MDTVTKKLRQFYQQQPRQFAQALQQMSEAELKGILWDWNIFGRDKQLSPEGLWRFWIALGGRSSGKSRTGSEWVIQRAKAGLGPIALIGQTSADVRDVMIEVGPSSIMQVCEPDFMPEYEPSKRRLTFPNGVVCTTFSGDQPEQLRGPQHQTVWIDELPKFSDPQETFDQMNFGLRIGDSRALITTTPTPHPIIKKFHKDWSDNPEGRTRVVVMPMKDNAANIDPEFLKDVEEKHAGTRLYRQEVMGEILWDSDSAYFKQDDIDKYRVEEAPDLVKIIIAVDPAVTSGKNSDDTGIIVAGVCELGHVYVLADKTMKGTPSQWATRIGDLYNHWNASAVICEKNQGGDLLTHTIQSHNPNLPVKLVTATRGKLVRAEPISLLFEQGKIHLVGNLPDLESEMVEYDGSQKKSPDSYDAFIWACTELMLGKRSHASTTEFLF